MSFTKDKIIKNSVKCLKCGDIITSEHIHDFVTCSCGNISCDGGHSYLKRSFMEYGTWEELSQTMPTSEKEMEE